MGAIFLDNNLNTEPIRNFLHSTMLPRLDPDIDYSREKPLMQRLDHIIQMSGCEAARIYKTDVTHHPALDYKIAHKRALAERVVTLKLVIHEEIISEVQASSTGLAKLKLAETSIAILTRENAKDARDSKVRDLCTCPPKVKVSDTKREDDEFNF